MSLNFENNHLDFWVETSIKQRAEIRRPLRKLLYFSRGEMIGGVDKSGNGENDRNSWNLDRYSRENIAKEVAVLNLESKVEV